MTPALLETAGGLPTTSERDEMRKSTAAERFWDRTDLNGPVPEYRPDLGPCWLWSGALHNGYGGFFADGQRWRVHRWSYEFLVGPIPEGLHLDHLCRVRHCVNPAHLEPVTNQENIRRGEAGKYQWARRRKVPPLAVGQFWVDNDVRAKGRTVIVEAFDDEWVQVRNVVIGRHTRVRFDRFRGGARGYRLKPEEDA